MSPWGWRRSVSRWAGLAGLVALATSCAGPVMDVSGYRARPGFDITRVDARGPDQFERLRTPGNGVPAATVDWDTEDTVLVVTAGGSHRAFLASDMVYHHVAQGTLAGVPFLVVY